MGWSDDAARNRELWTENNREYTDERASDNWALDEISWGIWGIDESELNVLGDVAGLDVVELGCGTAYFSAWLARLGARPVGVDITPAQLETARRMMAETGIEFPLVEADAAETGLPGASSTSSLSEYGASIWVDPYRWIPEAARLLRPGGRLVFLRNSTLVICARPTRCRRRAARQPAVRDAPLRVARGGRRVPSRSRRVDRPAARERVRGRAARRDPGTGRRRDAPPLLLRDGRLGEEVAVRGDLGRARR